MVYFFVFFIFSLLEFQSVLGSVPVFLWESIKSDQVDTFPALHRLGTTEFQQYLLMKGGENPNPLIAVFEEQQLSMEDFSWKDSQGQGHFTKLKYISENAANFEFLPSVQDPIGAINQLPASEFGYSLDTIHPSKIDDLLDGCGRILIIKLQETESKEKRGDLLRRHDIEIAEAYRHLLLKCNHVIGILSGKEPLWVEPEELVRVRRNATESNVTVTNEGIGDGIEDNTTTVIGGLYTLYQDKQGISMLYSSSTPKFYVDSKEVDLPSTQVGVSGDNSKPNIIKLFVKFNQDVRLSFNFDNNTSGYWYLRTVDLENGTVINLKSSKEIYAPLGMSYHCGSTVVFRNVTNDTLRELVFTDMQVEPFFFKAGSKSFSEAVDDVPFFTPAIWSGIFVTFLLALIFTWGLSMIMDIRTMDQFDDPKGKTITVSATD